MSKFTDEMTDVRNRIDSLGEAHATATTNTQAAVTGLEEKIAELRGTDLNADQRELVDGMQSDVSALRDATTAADDGYRPKTVEPAPVKGVKGKPAPGSVADRQQGST